MDLNISAEQKQLMQFSPQMLQSLNILMLPQLDLKERIYDEIEKNPALEIARESRTFKEKTEKSPEYSNYSRSSAAPDAGDNLYQFLESRPNMEETLQEHLLNQLAEISLPPAEEQICRLLIQNLDQRGYHRIAPEELLQSDPATANIEGPVLQKALQTVQGFDPVGVCCASLKESLLVQAKSKGGAPDFLIELLQSDFDFSGKNRLGAVLKDFPHRSQKEFDEALVFVRQLDPFPARNFSGEQTRYAVPDVYIYELDTDSTDIFERFAVVSADKDLPQLQIAPFFTELADDSAAGFANSSNAENSGAKSTANIEGNGADIKYSAKNAASSKSGAKNARNIPKDATRDFAVQKIKEAQTFIDALSQRNKTLLAVTKEILLYQKAFFLGVSPVPKPMRLQDVAEKLDLHLTTISRAVADKYLQCPQGFFEFKYFFQNAALGGAGAESAKKTAKPGITVSAAEEKNTAAVSKEAVKLLMQKLLEQAQAEGKKLSDEKLSKLLAEQGMPVSRRTVAKYRAQLNIASSYDR